MARGYLSLYMRGKILFEAIYVHGVKEWTSVWYRPTFLVVWDYHLISRWILDNQLKTWTGVPRSMWNNIAIMALCNSSKTKDTGLSLGKTMASQAVKWHQKTVWWGRIIPVQALIAKAYIHTVRTVGVGGQYRHSSLWVKLTLGSCGSWNYFSSGSIPLD